MSNEKRIEGSLERKIAVLRIPGSRYHPRVEVDRAAALSPILHEEGEPAAGDGVERIVTTSLADEIAFRVQSAILDGLYPPGSRLPQDELCEKFGVSRTPVREALRKLQAKNLVTVVPNKGATVRLLSRKELMDIYDLRSELEGYSCEQAAARITDRRINELDDAQGELEAVVEQVLNERSLEEEEPASLHVKLNRANEKFHTLIHRTGGNGLLLQLINDLGARFPKDYVSRAVRSSTEVRVINEEEHRRIRAALGAGDGRAARAEMREHILHARSVILRYLDERGFWK
jgi:DNA-binding GntR family transcriptional regulator